MRNDRLPRARILVSNDDGIDAPGIKVLDAKYGNWNRDDAFKMASDVIASITSSVAK